METQETDSQIAVSYFPSPIAPGIHPHRRPCHLLAQRPAAYDGSPGVRRAVVRRVADEVEPTATRQHARFDGGAANLSD